MRGCFRALDKYFGRACALDSVCVGFWVYFLAVEAEACEYGLLRWLVSRAN